MDWNLRNPSIIHGYSDALLNRRLLEMIELDCLIVSRTIRVCVGVVFKFA